MIIEWLGHSCFRLKSEDNLTLVMDPYDPNYTGLDCQMLNADIVTTSHNHGDHSAIHRVSGYKLHVNSIGNTKYKDISIHGIFSYHDDKKGYLRGNNIIFVIEMDGYKIAHLGDIGTSLNQNQVEKLQNVDILLIPVGGIYTIDSKQAIEIVDLLKPKLIIPMHYKTDKLKFELGRLNEFLKYFHEDRIEYLDTCEVEIKSKVFAKQVLVFSENERKE